jgi:hypothetical protein
MSDLQSEVLQEFRKLADECGAAWKVTDTFCELAKNGVTLRIRWSIERIPGVFVTLEAGTPEYGLPYLVEFRNGTEENLAAASSDDAKLTVNVAKIYATGFLEGTVRDFAAFAEFAEKHAAANVPPTPTILTNRIIRAECL